MPLMKVVDKLHTSKIHTKEEPRSKVGRGPMGRSQCPATWNRKVFPGPQIRGVYVAWLPREGAGGQQDRSCLPCRIEVGFQCVYVVRVIVLHRVGLWGTGVGFGANGALDPELRVRLLKHIGFVTPSWLPGYYVVGLFSLACRRKHVRHSKLHPATLCTHKRALASVSGSLRRSAKTRNGKPAMQVIRRWRKHSLCIVHNLALFIAQPTLHHQHQQPHHVPAGGSGCVDFRAIAVRLVADY